VTICESADATAISVDRIAKERDNPAQFESQTTGLRGDL